MAEMTLAAPPPAQLERAHDRLARSRSATTTSSRRASNADARGGTVVALTMPMLVEMNMSLPQLLRAVHAAGLVAT